MCEFVSKVDARFNNEIAEETAKASVVALFLGALVYCMALIF